MDLHPPTHVQLEISTLDVKDMFCLSVMQIFRSIGNHLHIGINLKNKEEEEDMLPLNHRGDKCQVLVHGPVSLLIN